MDKIAERVPDRLSGLRSWKVIFSLSLAVLFALCLWFSATAVLPSLSTEFQLGDSGRAGLTIAVQLGFIIGTLLSSLVNLTDFYPPRAVMIVSIIVAASANSALALWADSVWMILMLRGITGVCMAGIYPPAMKIMATWFLKRRGMAMGILIGALTVGSAIPHLIRGFSIDLPWRWTTHMASILALFGCCIVIVAVKEGPNVFPAAKFNMRMALENFRTRSLRLTCFGYFGHMWELYAMWTWIGGFLAASLQNSGSRLNPSLATFAVIAVGAMGCYIGGLASDRWGRTIVTTISLLISGACALTIGFTFGYSPMITLLVAGLWGMTINADSAQFSTAITELAQPSYVGTALTIQTCIGFTLTMVSIWMIPIMVSKIGWQWAFIILVIGPIFGMISMLRLRMLPDSLQLAQGRR